MMIERIKGFLENIREYGVLGAIKYSINEKVRKVKEFLGFTELEYTFSNNNINEIIDYVEEKEEHEEKETERERELIRFRFRMNPIA